MRVISGTARGTKLFTLEGEETRPTLDRVRESVFNIIQSDIRDADFLDLFSGSGAISIEAASRGARKVVACERSKRTIDIIKKNIEKTHLEEKIEVCNMDYKECLKKLENHKFDLIYLDPPYKTDYAYISIEYLLKNGLLKNTTKIIVETDSEKNIEEIQKQEVMLIDKRKYGRAIIAFFQKNN